MSRRHMLGLVLSAALIAGVCAQTSGTVAPQDLAAIQALNASITNFAEVVASPGFFGWRDELPCATGVGWTGVMCDTTVTPARVSSLNLAVLAPGLVQGTLPAGLSNLTAATTIVLQSQSFSGSLPPEWGTGGFDALTRLVLSQNKLTGSLPSEWGSPTGFQALQDLELYNNSISGSLPDSWGTEDSFPALLNLVLESNELTGELPEAWSGGLPSLLQLNVFLNQLDGPLPAAWTFSNLTQLQVGGNKLTGTLPEEYPSQLPKLELLDAGTNSLSGPVPSSWDSWNSLTSLVLFPNAGLCGTIDANLVRTPDGQGNRITVLGAAATNATNGDIVLPPCTASQLAGLAPTPAPATPTVVPISAIDSAVAASSLLGRRRLMFV